MPNHINNYLVIEGTDSEVINFFDYIKLGFSFTLFVPMPDKVFRGDLGRKEEAMYPGEENWYGWACKCWGTKWNAYNVDISRDENMVAFQTAWNVPLPVLLAISKQFPLLKFTNEWIEETLESAGRLVLQNSCTVSEESESHEGWKNKQPNYIHSLNLKYNKDDYKEYLEELAEDEEDEDKANIYHYYLKLIEIDENPDIYGLTDVFPAKTIKRTPKEVNDSNLYQYEKHLLLLREEIESELKRAKDYRRNSWGFRPSEYIHDYCRNIQSYWQRLFSFSEIEE